MADAPINEKSAPRLRLLAVLAHPDDESLGVGSALARYASEGVDVYLLTATRGEAGRYRGRRRGESGHPGPEALAAIRETELRSAAAVLGIRDVAFLGYRDQLVDAADPREAVDAIAAHVRRVQPHVVVTFGPDGAYGHPDHIAVSQFTTAAIASAARGRPGGDATGAGDEPHVVSKLYYIAWSEAAWNAYQAAVGRLSATVDGVERRSAPWPEWAITTAVDTTAFWETAWKAVSCHESQIAGYERLKALSPHDHRALWGAQSFYRALSLVNGGRTREVDLFAGIR